jgi:hypothetical protein
VFPRPGRRQNLLGDQQIRPAVPRAPLVRGQPASQQLRQRDGSAYQGEGKSLLHSRREVREDPRILRRTGVDLKVVRLFLHVAVIAVVLAVDGHGRGGRSEQLSQAIAGGSRARGVGGLPAGDEVVAAAGIGDTKKLVGGQQKLLEAIAAGGDHAQPELVHLRAHEALDVLQDQPPRHLAHPQQQRHQVVEALGAVVQVVLAVSSSCRGDWGG